MIMSVVYRWNILADLSIKLMVEMSVVIDVVDKSGFGQIFST